MPFENRPDAGRKLARALAAYKDQDPVVLALPRGGVPVAAEVATALGALLDIVLVRKLGVPHQPELAMGALVDGREPIIVRNDEVIKWAGVNDAQFTRVCERERAEIARRRRLYLGQRTHAEISGRNVIVIDDGLATGATMRAALHATRARGPQKLVLAIPVAPTMALALMHGEADDVVCLETYEPFGAIGYYYKDFTQTSDEEVIRALARSPVASPT